MRLGEVQPEEVWLFGSLDELIYVEHGALGSWPHVDHPLHGANSSSD